MVIWAAVLEFERPRRGGVVWLLLFAASLMRPEAWLLMGIYWLWMFGPATWCAADQVGPPTPRPGR